MSRLERIVEACGGELSDGGRRALIPGPGHSPRDRSVSLLEADDGRILIFCFSPKDDWREVRRGLAERGLLTADAEEKATAWTSHAPTAPRGGERLARARKFWAEAQPVRGTLAERYLLKRAIPASVTQSTALRFHPRMTSLEDRVRRPALLSAIIGSDDQLQGIEITLLSSYGAAKAALGTPRRAIGKMMGGAVRLGRPGEKLVIAEGMESAASASAALRLPAWALLSAHNLSLFTPPATVTLLIVASDNDAAGHAAYQRLKRRLQSVLNMERALPPDGFNDWNDWARATHADCS